MHVVESYELVHSKLVYRVLEMLKESVWRSGLRRGVPEMFGFRLAT